MDSPGPSEPSSRAQSTSHRRQASSDKYKAESTTKFSDIHSKGRRRDRAPGGGFSSAPQPGDGRYLIVDPSSSEAYPHNQQIDGSFLLRPEASPFQPPGLMDLSNGVQTKSRSRRERGRGGRGREGGEPASIVNPGVAEGRIDGITLLPSGSAQEGTEVRQASRTEHCHEVSRAHPRSGTTTSLSGYRGRPGSALPMGNDTVVATAADAVALALATGHVPSREQVVVAGRVRQKRRDPRKADAVQQQQHQQQRVNRDGMKNLQPDINPTIVFEEEDSRFTCCICCGER